LNKKRWLNHILEPDNFYLFDKLGKGLVVLAPRGQNIHGARQMQTINRKHFELFESGHENIADCIDRVVALVNDALVELAIKVIGHSADVKHVCLDVFELFLSTSKKKGSISKQTLLLNVVTGENMSEFFKGSTIS